MIRRILVNSILIMALASATSAADKGSVRVQKISNPEIKNQAVTTSPAVSPSPGLATADLCVVSEYDEIAWQIDGWIIGFELYKSLMDPANSCPNPYPFAVTEINLPMVFAAGTSIVVATDVEAVDSVSVPGCTVPGAVLGVSAEYTAQIPAAGMYNISIPLDEPVLVTGPFFAGFYIGNTFADSVAPAVLTDDTPVPCTNFNIWDETIGWQDLANNEYFNFPGRLVMEASGYPGAGPVPDPEFLQPLAGANLLGEQNLRIWDKNLTGRSEYALFEYSSGGAFVEIGTDFDGIDGFRDGISPATVGDGFSFNWDFSSLPEGYYDLRATLVDSSGRAASTTINVYLEPTPPVARITSPTEVSDFCAPVDIAMSTADENISFIEVQHREAAEQYSAGLVPFAQATVGDNDGDPNDGNPVSAGEFGEYYAAPVAAAVGIMQWVDRGYTALVTEGSTTLTREEVAESLAALFGTRVNLGTSDVSVLAGLKSYTVAHGSSFKFGYTLLPDYRLLRRAVEANQQTALLGIGGFPGMWVTVDGFDGWADTDSTYGITVANPMNGTVQNARWRRRTGYSEINLMGYWQRVDLMVTMVAAGWSVARTTLGVDVNGGDGWLVNWTPEALPNGTWHYLRSVGHDQDNLIGYSEVLARHDCSGVYEPGDYNGDDVADWSDLVYLIEFITYQGDPPIGGAERADATCDHVVNIADVIYFLNYLYAMTSAPCR